MKAATQAGELQEILHHQASFPQALLVGQPLDTGGDGAELSNPKIKLVGIHATRFQSPRTGFLQRGEPLKNLRAVHHAPDTVKTVTPPRAPGTLDASANGQGSAESIPA